ncbi:MAG: methionine adenosyltransferase [Candidatus Diapherotrites archaeon]|nr:methionine adenosyltransferase [Candidatus Diapherotrites archaeon]
MAAKKFLFTSESVTEGHPDKICDRVSDAFLDEALRQDPKARVAVETLTTTGLILIAGEVSTKGYVDTQKIVREALRDIGYTNPEYGIDASDCCVLTAIHEQSGNIAVGVNDRDEKGMEKEQGAGDQGLMFGYACNETPELMPLPIMLAHRLAMRLAEVRKKKILDWVRPDGKTQVTVEYVDGKPKRIDAIVIAVHHSPRMEKDGKFSIDAKEQIMEHVIKPICAKWIDGETKIFINATGIFEKGGPEADTGVTGRKIIVDTYGGMGRHGGGAFSGKDPTKVDRSGAYMARHIAKNIVAAGLAEKCEVQIAYSIGRAEPVSVFVDTLGTGRAEDEKIADAVKKIFPLRPAEIIKYLDLLRPIYSKTSAYGHFGRNDPDFTWEKTDKAEELRKALA